MFCYLILQILVQTGKKVAAKMRITCERPFHNSDKLSISELKLAKSIVFKLIKKRPFSRFCSRYPSVFWGSLKSFLGVTKCPLVTKLGVHLRKLPRLSFRVQKEDIISSSIPSVIQIQREAFSGFSMRNRGILEKELGQSRSDREQRLQKQIRYAVEEPHSR